MSKKKKGLTRKKIDNAYGSGLEKELDSILGTDVKKLSAQAKREQREALYEEEDEKGGIGVKGIIAIVVLVLVIGSAIGVGGAYVYKAQDYRTVYFPKTYINGIDCNGKTPDDVAEEIRQKVENYAFTITFRDDSTLVLDGKDIDYTYQKSAEIDNILEKQNIMDWYRQSDEKKEYTVENSTKFSDAKVSQLIKDSEQLDPLNQVQPEDAYMDFKKSKYVIVEEKQGNKIDGDVLAKAVCQAIEDGKTELKAEDTGCYAEPAVTSEDEDLVEKVETLNKYAGASITYTLPQGKKVLNGKTLIKWLDKDENGKYTKDEDKFAKKIKEYVEKLAEETDTYKDTVKFKSTEGTEVEVKMVDTGWKIDQEAEIKTLTKNIDEAETVKREPEYSVKMRTSKNGGFGKTYIEADLTSQHVYYYKAGDLVWESDCVSGKMTEDRYTPSGVYLLDTKEKDRDLKGKKLANGEYSYISHVNYWMPFLGGYGFHDATWRYRFGGKIYNYYGSHGCINLPKDKAEALYDLIEMDTPIVIFYREEYTLRPAEPVKITTDEGTNKTTDTTDTTDTNKTDNTTDSADTKTDSTAADTAAAADDTANTDNATE